MRKWLSGKAEGDRKEGKYVICRFSDIEWKHYYSR